MTNNNFRLIFIIVVLFITNIVFAQNVPTPMTPPPPASPIDAGLILLFVVAVGIAIKKIGFKK